jgi:hypothetical protein
MSKGILILGALLLLTSPIALACVCAAGDAKQKLRRSDSVFLGKVTSVENLGAQTDNYGEQRIRVTFDVQRRFKGRRTDVTLDTVINEVSCSGSHFQQGENMLVYAFRTPQGLDVSWCGGVVKEKENDFKDEIRQLRRLAQ